jgi:hypothetical protein
MQVEKQEKKPERMKHCFERLNQAQSLFAEDIAAGKTILEAYKNNYNIDCRTEQSIKSCANQVYKNPLVQKRINKLRRHITANIEYTVINHFQELEVAQEKALKWRDNNGNPNLNAYLRATELKGKVKGLYIERKEINAKIEHETPVLDRLAEILKEKIKETELKEVN